MSGSASEADLAGKGRVGETFSLIIKGCRAVQLKERKVCWMEALGLGAGEKTAAGQARAICLGKGEIRNQSQS